MAHYLLGRGATALPNGVEINSFAGTCRIIPYSEIQRCLIRPKRENIRIFSERSDTRFDSVILIGVKSYAMKMSKQKAESFVRHLKKYAPEIVISTDQSNGVRPLFMD